MFMNKMYEEKHGKNSKKTIGLCFRSVSEKKDFRVTRSVTNQENFKAWNSKQNSIEILDQKTTQHGRFHYKQENLLYNLYFEKVMVPQYGGIREM